MQINVITRHAPANYGSLLQTIATQKILEKMGKTCEIIDFVPREEVGWRVAFTQLRQKEEWNNRVIKKIIYLLVREPVNLLMHRMFKKMRKKYLKMTIHFSTFHELKEYFCDSDDIFMTGSDQVWGPISIGVFEPVYFLNFVPSRCKRVSFASSFGKSSFDENIMNIYKEYLKKYNDILVRENTALEILNKMDIQATQVLDPTLLLEQEDWLKYISKNEKQQGAYILIYQIHSNSKLNQYAKNLSIKTGIPLVRISSMLHQVKRGGKFIYLPDIDKFLWYIKNAKYLVTDSFHGTAFAINFNVQFIEILSKTGTGSRNQSILQLFGLENRIVEDMDDYSIVNEIIDYDGVNKILDDERKKTKKALNNLMM